MRGKLGYLVIVFLTFGLYLWTNVAATFFLFLFLVVFAGFMWICNWYVAGKIVVELTVDGEIADRAYGLHIQTENRAYLPVFRLIIKGQLLNCLTDSLMPFSREISVAPRGKKHFTVSFESSFCGRLEGEIRELVVSDFLGIFQSKIPGNQLTVCYAYPHEIQKEEYEVDLSAPDEHNIQNRYLNRKGNDITEILDIRDYQKGDSIKTIHWKLSKKLGRKVVRELDTPANQEIILFMALSEQNRDNPVFRDRIVELASSISSDLLEEEKFYDAVVFDRERGISHKYSVEEIYTRDLYEHTMLDGDVNFKQSEVEGYIRSHNVLRRYAFVILITDLDLAGWFSESGNVRQIFVSV